MADTKTTGLSTLSVVAIDDVLYIVDDTGGTPTSKKVTIEKLFGGINVLTTESSISGSVDKVAIYSSSNSDARGVLIDDLPVGIHGGTHASGGTDAIKLDDLSAPDDNTDLNATSSAHGLLPKLSGSATDFLNGTGAYSTPAGAPIGSSYVVIAVDGSLTDERALAVTSGELALTDGGAGGSVTLGLATNPTVAGNLTVTGNLTISGTTTTFESTTVVIDDSLIKLAKDNTAADVVDAGFYSVYDTAGTDKYSGLFRDASDGKYRLFKDSETEPTTTVNTAATGYAVATLVADLEGTVGGVTVTAHATRHESGGADEIKLDDLGAPDDNTDLDASASAHGLLPKLSGSASDVLAGDGTWTAAGGAPTGSQYITLAADATLSAERVLTGTSNQITITDNGAGSTVVLSTPQNIDTGATPAFTGADLSAGTATLATVAGAINAGGATSLEIPNSVAPTVNADGEIAIDTTVTDFSHGLIKYYSGEELAVVAMPIAELTTPSDGTLVSYNATNDEFELVAQAGGGDMSAATYDPATVSEQLVGLTATQTLTNKTLTAPAIGTSILDSGGNELFLLTATASAVNQVTYANSATGNDPTFTASGDDTNIGINLVGKGSGVIQAGGVEVATISGTQTLTNKTINTASNTITVAEADISDLGTTAAMVADNLSVFAATTSSQLAGVISDETGTGALVFASSPAFVTPALGTPASGVMTNVTGTAAGLTAGNVTTNANLTGHVTSVGNAAVLGSFTLAQLNTAISDGSAGDFLADGSVPMTGDFDGDGNNLSDCGVLFLREQAAADADVAGQGQFWVQTATPNIPMFTDDAGTDFQLASLAGTETLTNKTINTASNTITVTESDISDLGTTAAMVADNLSVFAATTSAQLAGVISDETGSGSLVFGTSPTLVTPALGTPSSGVLTNCSGTAASLTAGNVTTNANLTGHVTSVGNAAVLGSFTVAQLNTAISDGTVLTNVVDDTTPQLGGQLDVNGQAIGDGTLELLTFVETGSAVNHVQVTNAATGNGPDIAAVGDDTNVDLNLTSKDTGDIVSSDNHKFVGSVHQAWNEMTDGATITLDGNDGNRQWVEIGATGRTLNFTNLKNGQAIILRVRQDATGSRTITTWGTNASVNWPGGTAPTLTTTGNRSDLIGLLVEDNTTDAEVIYGMVIEQDFVDS